MNRYPIIALVLLLFSCSSATKQPWGYQTVADCDSGIVQTVRIQSKKMSMKGVTTKRLDVVVYGACGPQLISDVDSIFSFRMKPGDSLVKMDMRFNDLVVDDWNFPLWKLNEIWFVDIQERPFDERMERLAPKSAIYLISICHGGTCTAHFY